MSYFQQELPGATYGATYGSQWSSASQLNTIFEDQEAEEIEFFSKFTTRLEKLMTAYCRAREFQAASLQCSDDGIRVEPSNAAEPRGIETNDTVHDLRQQQVGSAEKHRAEATLQDKKRLEIVVKDQTLEEVVFKMSKTSPMSKVINGYCQRNNKDRNAVRFVFEGTRIHDTDTPLTLEMEDGDIIEVYLE